jgi:hypothetical protein
MNERKSEAGFEIEGRKYPIPMLDSFDMNEAQILFDYANVTLEDFAPAHPDWPDEEREKYEADQLTKVRNPAFKRALLHVAYARGNPGQQFEFVREIIGRANTLDVTVALLTEDDASPPVETSSPRPPSRSTDTRTLSKPEASGTGSPNGSDAPDVSPASTGDSSSDTSSQESAPTTSGLFGP